MKIIKLMEVVTMALLKRSKPKTATTATTSIPSTLAPTENVKPPKTVAPAPAAPTPPKASVPRPRVQKETALETVVAETENLKAEIAEPMWTEDDLKQSSPPRSKLPAAEAAAARPPRPGKQKPDPVEQDAPVEQPDPVVRSTTAPRPTVRKKFKDITPRDRADFKTPGQLHELFGGRGNDEDNPVPLDLLCAYLKPVHNDGRDIPSDVWVQSSQGVVYKFIEVSPKSRTNMVRSRLKERLAMNYMEGEY